MTDFEVCLRLVGCFNLTPLSRKKPGGCYRGICCPPPGSGTQHCKVKATCHQAGLLGHGWQSSVCWAHNTLGILSGFTRDTSFKPAPSKTHLTEPHPFSQLSGTALDSLPKLEPCRGAAPLLNAAGGGLIPVCTFQSRQAWKLNHPFVLAHLPIPAISTLASSLDVCFI